MDEAQRIFEYLFPNEKIESKHRGRFHSKIIRNVSALKVMASGRINYQPATNCSAIVGEDHIFIDTRNVTRTNIKLFLITLPIILLVGIAYAWYSGEFIAIVIFLFAMWPIPLMVVLSYITGVKGGSGSYLIDRRWISKMEVGNSFVIEGKIPGGQPYTLSQYIAMNDIHVPEFLSGKAAWLGTLYPFSYLETSFKINVTPYTKGTSVNKYLSLVFPVILFLLVIMIMTVMITIFRG